MKKGGVAKDPNIREMQLGIKAPVGPKVVLLSVVWFLYSLD